MCYLYKFALIFCCFSLLSSGLVYAGDYVREELITKKAPEQYLKDGVITKQEAVRIAKDEISHGKYKDCFNYFMPTIGYDESGWWAVQFRPKQDYRYLYCYGVMVNKHTGEVLIGDFEGL